MSNKNQSKIVFVDYQKPEEIIAKINAIPGFKCSMNQKQCDIILTKNKKANSDKYQMTFEEFTERYAN